MRRLVGAVRMAPLFVCFISSAVACRTPRSPIGEPDCACAAQPDLALEGSASQLLNAGVHTALYVAEFQHSPTEIARVALLADGSAVLTELLVNSRRPAACLVAAEHTRNLLSHVDSLVNGLPTTPYEGHTQVFGASPLQVLRPKRGRCELAVRVSLHDSALLDQSASAQQLQLVWTEMRSLADSEYCRPLAPGGQVEVSSESCRVWIANRP
jgi:hypothetical protein